MINNKRLNTLKKLIDMGYTSPKDIISLTAEDLVAFCRSIEELTNIIELQKALKDNKLVQYLADMPLTEDTKEK